MDLQKRVQNSDLNKVASESGIDKMILLRIKSGEGRPPHRHSLQALEAYFMKSDAGFKFK